MPFQKPRTKKFNQSKDWLDRGSYKLLHYFGVFLTEPSASSFPFARFNWYLDSEDDSDDKAITYFGYSFPSGYDQFIGVAIFLKQNFMSAADIYSKLRYIHTNFDLRAIYI